MRDNLWLEQKLNTIWNEYFSDVKKLNTIKIHFGRKAKRRLASIRQANRYIKNSDTEINVSGFYKDLKVPEFVVDVTIAHELCHYAHGFASPLPQFSKFPHKGDVVDNELRKRGLGQLLDTQEKWLKDNWNMIVNDEVFIRKHRYTRRRSKKRMTFVALFNKLVLNN